jgi:glycosyltransferase involved in cell wall biosynthesis
MHIVVNTQLLIENKLEGLGWFTFEVLRKITSNHPEHQFTFLFNQPYSNEFIFSKNVKPMIVGPKYNHPLTWFIKFEVILPSVLKKLNADLYFSPDGWCSIRSNVKTVAVIHDINFVHFPKHLPFWYRTYYNIFFPLWAKKAVRLATVSEFSKADIVRQYKIDPSKIDVVYNGANENLSPISEEKKDKVRQEVTQGNPYFVFVGATPPRKNLINLFKAFDLFKKQQNNSYKLVLVGAKKWWNDAIRQSYDEMQFRNDVIFTGRVSTSALNEIVAASEAMTYVSLFEGFGIPLLEAMWCETAIITSNCTSMPEVAKDSAIYVDPFSPQSIADGMQTIASNPELRQQLIENGRIRRHDFSWEASADRLWKCIEKAL